MDSQLVWERLGIVLKQNSLLAVQRGPSGLDKPERLRSTATFKVGNLFWENPLMLISRSRKFIGSIFALWLLSSTRLFAGDLERLTNEQISSGYGQLQDGPSNPPENRSPPKSSSSKPRSSQNQSDLSPDHCEGDSFSSQCIKLAFGVVCAAAYGVAQKVDPPGISVWEVQPIPREFQFNTIWYFESRSNQQLLVGHPMSNASRFDWTGTPGFQVRLATQPILRLGLEFLFDYAKHDELFSFFNVTDFATYPNISFAENSVTTERLSSLAIGQWNILLRDQPYTFAFAGLRWWHQEDELRLNVLQTGAAWRNTSKSDAPFFQIGGQYGATGTRWMWLNRIAFGIGASRNSSRTTASQVVGTYEPIDLVGTNFSALVDCKTEFAMAFTERFSVRFGSQLIGISGRIRSSEQIDVTNLSTSQSRLNNDSIVLSALFAGASYQF